MKMESVRSLALRVRRNILEMTFHAGMNGGHLGGGLSCADILSVLYNDVMHHSPELVASPERDRFFLSKGHVALAHYAVLVEKGYFPKSELETFELDGSCFPTHEVMCLEKGIESSSGSLGYGLSMAVGCALAGKRKGKSYHVYVLLGDGECNEGTVWEAAMSASRFGLDNLTAIVDVNGQSLDGFSKNVMPVFDFASAFRGFGWQVMDVDGHDVDRLRGALLERAKDQPVAVLAHTIKGKGIPSIEGKTGWHHANLSEEMYHEFLAELEAGE